MGYPVTYRTSAARDPAFRGSNAPTPQDNSPFNRNNQNENKQFRDPRDSKPQPNYRLPEKIPQPRPYIPNDRPPGVNPAKTWENKSPPLPLSPSQLRKLTSALRWVNPWFRLAHNLWDLWDLYNWYQSTRTTNGDWVLCASDNYEINPLSPCDTYMGGPVFSSAQGACNTVGLLTQAMAVGPQFYKAGFADVPGNFVQMGVYMLRPPSPPCGIGGRGHHYQHWTRTSTAAGRVPAPPNRVPYFRVTPSPVTPFKRLPTYRPVPGRFEPDPLPVPYPVIPELDPREWPGSDGNTDPSVRSQPDIDVQQAPKWERTAHRKPPGPRVKERKFKGVKSWAQQALFAAFRAHGKLNDFRDLLLAMHDALPKELQLKGKDKKQLPKILRRVWDNLDKMDGEKALANIVKELAEDVVGGFGDMLKTKASANFGWSKQKFFLQPRF